ncbi:transcription factor bHLH92 isoform X2 [Vitis riparia]|uniref:transcription factor bHLH92 isoform X2 n=1 Tax=Vitis riparia TaxID=96939 RepID=UPI00155B2B5F|nr:transcription factor bHLH92 isoform X2 [Vitis riparia]
MMDHFFDYGHQHEMFWFEYPPMNSNPPTQEFHSENSAFAPYRSQPIPGDGGVGGSNRRNMNSRMMELLRGNWSAIRNSGESDRGRSYRHMMRERARRENQKQSYLALHSLLPHGTKSDKNSIIEMAKHEIQKLQSSKEELKRRNQELNAKLREGTMVLNIGLKVGNPSSGIDSMEEVLKCLKNMDLKTTSIQSQFSPQQISAAVKIQTQNGAGTLHEVKRNLNSNFREGWFG